MSPPRAKSLAEQLKLAQDQLSYWTTQLHMAEGDVRACQRKWQHFEAEVKRVQAEIAARKGKRDASVG